MPIFDFWLRARQRDKSASKGKKSVNNNRVWTAGRTEPKH